MKKTIILLLCIGLLAGLCACANGNGRENGGEDVTAESSRDPVNLLTGLKGGQRALAEVLNENLKKYGKPSFTMGNISHVMGAGLVLTYDLDQDGQVELIMVHQEKDENDYFVHEMEIWAYQGLSAKRLYSGSPYRLGADNKGISLLAGEDGAVYIRYDTRETMNGRYLGCIRGGTLTSEEITEQGYDSETSVTLLNGRPYTELCSYVVSCYNYEKETDEYNEWKSTIKEIYGKALLDLGLTKEDGTTVYSPGLLSLLDHEYLKLKTTHVDAAGTIESVWDFEYDAKGNETRVYKNDTLYSESVYNDAGILIYDVEYKPSGQKREENIYDDNGNLLESNTYNGEDDKASWTTLYTYDENGWVLTATNGISGLKEYEYNDDGEITQMRTVDERDGSVYNTHVFTFDEQGRHVADYLYKEDMRLLYSTWEYYDDGTWQQTDWSYEYLDENADRVYAEGEETVSLITLYNADGLPLKKEMYAQKDFGVNEPILQSEYEYAYDRNGEILHSVENIYNFGTLTYEIITDCERTPEGKRIKETKTYRTHTYRELETEHETTYVTYEAEFNEKGYLIHAYLYECDDPFHTDEVYLDREIYYLYANSFGDKMGIDY